MAPVYLNKPQERVLKRVPLAACQPVPRRKTPKTLAEMPQKHWLTSSQWHPWKVHGHFQNTFEEGKKTQRGPL
jgi:hypothetical protein